MESETENSIDASLQAFFDKQKITIEETIANVGGSHTDSRVRDDSLDIDLNEKLGISGDIPNLSASGSDDVTFEQSSYSVEDVDHTSLTTLTKVNAILEENAYPPISLVGYDTQEGSVPLAAVESMSESFLIAAADMVHRLKTHEKVVQETSMHMQRDTLSNSALETRVSDLQEKLYAAEEKMKSMEMSAYGADSKADVYQKRIKDLEAEMKKAAKSFSLQLQESERRVRQKEIEMERYRTKLSQLNTKEKDTESKRKSTLSGYRKGELSIDMNTSAVSKRSSGGRRSAGGSPGRYGKSCSRPSRCNIIYMLEKLIVKNVCTYMHTYIHAYVHTTCEHVQTRAR